MGNVANNRCDKTIMKKFGDLMKRISPFVAAFKMIHEVEQ